MEAVGRRGGGRHPGGLVAGRGRGPEGAEVGGGRAGHGRHGAVALQALGRAQLGEHGQGIGEVGRRGRRVAGGAHLLRETRVSGGLSTGPSPSLTAWPRPSVGLTQRPLYSQSQPARSFHSTKHASRPSQQQEKDTPAIFTQTRAASCAERPPRGVRSKGLIPTGSRGQVKARPGSSQDTTVASARAEAHWPVNNPPDVPRLRVQGGRPDQVCLPGQPWRGPCWLQATVTPAARVSLPTAPSGFPVTLSRLQMRKLSPDLVTGHTPTAGPSQKRSAGPSSEPHSALRQPHTVKCHFVVGPPRTKPGSRFPESQHLPPPAALGRGWQSICLSSPSQPSSWGSPQTPHLLSSTLGGGSPNSLSLATSEGTPARKGRSWGGGWNWHSPCEPGTAWGDGGAIHPPQAGSWRGAGSREGRTERSVLTSPSFSLSQAARGVYL